MIDSEIREGRSRVTSYKISQGLSEAMYSTDPVYTGLFHTYL